MADSFSAWVSSVPPVTRVLLFTPFSTALAISLGILDARSLYLDWSFVYSDWQIWRLVTPFVTTFFRPALLFNLYFLYRSSSTLETELFAGRRPDYVACLIFIWLSALLISIIPLTPFSFPFYFDVLILAITQIWAQFNKTMPVNFLFFRFPAMYLPFVLLLMDLVNGQGIKMDMVLGILIGHAYYVLDHLYPQQNGGRKILTTPQFIVDLVGNGDLRFGGFAPSTTGPGGSRTTSAGAYTVIDNRQRTQPDTPAAGIRHRWGRGSALGET